ncbi:MAG: UDP-2,3-diacylglucosamine diphosphatase [Pseudomonadota bacterium]
MATAVPRFAQLDAAPDWRTAEFISDLHLQAGEPATFEAWERYMQATQADAVFILGDLFEVWVGDDAAGDGTFEGRCAAVLQGTARRTRVFFMHGNRDFLVGRAFLASLGVTLLDDPTVLLMGGQRWLLSHGDELCLDDVEYLLFRAQVRSAHWQQEFLAKPLEQRKGIARGLREQSEALKRSGADYADVDAAAAREWLQEAQATTLIHGHTHKPADHDLGWGMRRVVMSDWDAAATPARMQVLRLSAGNIQRVAAG